MDMIDFDEWFALFEGLATEDDFEVPPLAELRKLYDEGLSPTDALVQLQIESVGD